MLAAFLTSCKAAVEPLHVFLSSLFSVAEMTVISSRKQSFCVVSV